MLFTSWAFVRFFAVVLLALRFAPSRTARQWVLLVASCVFYAHWEPWYLLLLPGVALVCWSRVVVEYHTVAQVVVGALIGPVLGGVVFLALR